MKKDKLYFKSEDSSFCYPLDDHLNEARHEGLDEVELIEAVYSPNEDHIWCSYFGDAVDRSDCRKSECAYYASKSGRGVCKNRGHYFLYGEKKIFKTEEMKTEPTEAIKEQIEQKAREYVLIPIDVNIDTYASEEQIGSYNDFLAGAEAMREIVNTWYDIENNPPASCQTAVSSSHSEIEFHIQKRRQERDRILSCWNEIEKLNEQSKFSMDCYQELQARISSQLASIDRSIQDHKRLL